MKYSYSLILLLSLTSGYSCGMEKENDGKVVTVADIKGPEDFYKVKDAAQRKQILTDLTSGNNVNIIESLLDYKIKADAPIDAPIEVYRSLEQESKGSKKSKGLKYFYAVSTFLLPGALTWGAHHISKGGTGSLIGSVLNLGPAETKSALMLSGLLGGIAATVDREYAPIFRTFALRMLPMFACAGWISHPNAQFGLECIPYGIGSWFKDNPIKDNKILTCVTVAAFYLMMRPGFKVAEKYGSYYVEKALHKVKLLKNAPIWPGDYEKRTYWAKSDIANALDAKSRALLIINESLKSK